MQRTKIPWCDYTWNPVTGCTKVTSGCKNCYAEAMAKRFWGSRKFSEVRCHKERLIEPQCLGRPSRIFLNSMSDLFHPEVPFEFISEVLWVIYEYSHHTYIVLTKRPERALEYANWQREATWVPQLQFLKNLWFVVSVSNQEDVDRFVPVLQQIPVAIRGVSCEPLLSMIDLSAWLEVCVCGAHPSLSSEWRFNGQRWEHQHLYPVGHLSTVPSVNSGIDWVIAGCESGPGARAADERCFWHLMHQCRENHVPFFLKQMKVGEKLVKMPKLDNRVWDEYPKERSHDNIGMERIRESSAGNL